MKPEKPEVNFQRWLRIAVTAWAYAYEYENESLVPDDVYDYASRLIDPKIKTGRRKLDTFFATKFDPDTGMWIRDHPELPRADRLYRNMRQWKQQGGYANFQSLPVFKAFLAERWEHLKVS